MTTALSCALIFPTACTTRHTVGMLKDIETYIQERPDSALKELRAVDASVLRSSAAKARYSLLYTMALDKNYEDITMPGLLDQAVRWYGRHGNPDEKFKTRYYQGRIAQSKRDRNEAVVYFSMAEELAGQVKDLHSVGLLYLAEATLYETVHNLTKAKEYTEKGLAMFSATDDPKKDAVLGQLAVIYFEMKEWDRADSLFRQGLEASCIYPQAQSVFLSNYAQMKVLQPTPDPEGALVLLERMQKQSGAPLSLRDAGAYAYALILCGRRKDAEGILKLLERQAQTHPLQIKPWLSRCALALGDYEHAYEIFSQAHVVEEEEIQKILSDSMAEALSKHHREAVMQNKAQYRLNLALCAIIVLALLLAWTLTLIKKKKVEEDRERLLGIYAVLKKEAAEHEKRTGDLQHQLSRLRETARQERILRFRQTGRLQSSLWRMEQLGVPGWMKKDPSMEAMKKELSYIYDIDESGEKMVRRLDGELGGMIMPLLEQLNMQKKTQDQLFFCCCLLDLPSDLIASKFGITPNNVRVRKFRLREQIARLNNPDYDALFNIVK